MERPIKLKIVAYVYRTKWATHRYIWLQRTTTWTCWQYCCRPERTATWEIRTVTHARSWALTGWLTWWGWVELVTRALPRTMQRITLMTLTDFAIRVPTLYFTCLDISSIIGAKCTEIWQVIVGIIVQNCCNQGGKRGSTSEKRAPERHKPRLKSQTALIST